MQQLTSIGCAELRFAPVSRRRIISTERSELMNTYIKKHKVNNRKTCIAPFPIGYAELRFAPVPRRGIIKNDDAIKALRAIGERGR
jgi:hypothetical protein